MGFVVLIVVCVALFGLAMFVKQYSFWLSLVLVSIMFGCIGGALTNWIFDSFSWGFWIASIGGGLCILGERDEYDSSGSSDDYDVADYGSSSSGNYSSGSSYQSYSSRSSYSSDNDYEERERQRRSAENRASYERDADNAYSRYESYKSEAERYADQADTELRYAEDYERRGREFDDSSALSQASSCRSSAEYCMREARSAKSQADYYYNLYLEYKERARNS